MAVAGLWLHRCACTGHVADLFKRTSLFLSLVARLVCFPSSCFVWSGPTPTAYSTHQQLIDQSWTAITVPVLLGRHPSLTPEQLTKAHAYAYVVRYSGPWLLSFRQLIFLVLTHHCSGDFVGAFFAMPTVLMSSPSPSAHSALLGRQHRSLAGHKSRCGYRVSKTPCPVRAFSGLRSGKNAHSQVELHYIYQLANQHLGPSEYLRYIGLRVPRQHLRRSARPTDWIRDILGLYRTTLRTYRFGARAFLPAFAYAEAAPHQRRFPTDTPSAELTLYERRVAELAGRQWSRHRKKPGIGTTYSLFS